MTIFADLVRLTTNLKKEFIDTMLRVLEEDNYFYINDIPVFWQDMLGFENTIEYYVYFMIKDDLPFVIAKYESFEYTGFGYIGVKISVAVDIKTSFKRKVT